MRRSRHGSMLKSNVCDYLLHNRFLRLNIYLMLNINGHSLHSGKWAHSVVSLLLLPIKYVHWLFAMLGISPPPRQAHLLRPPSPGRGIIRSRCVCILCAHVKRVLVYAF